MSEDWVEGLYRLHGPLVFRRARALLGNEDEAWEVVQEVFARMLRSRTTFRHEAAPTTWLYRITTNTALNRVRDTSRRRANLHALVAEQRLEVPVFEATPEIRLMLAHVLERIPAPLCEIAVYYHLDHMNQDEIAAVIGTSRKTVGNRLREFHALAQGLLGQNREASA